MSSQARSYPVLFLLALMTAAACRSDVKVGPVDSATLAVLVSTEGSHLDADGYVLRLASSERAIPINGSTEFTELAVGSYPVTLTGLASNCSVIGAETVTAVLDGSSGASVVFEVDCLYDTSGSVLPEVACMGMEPAALRGRPGASVSLGTLPTSLDPPLFARFSWPEGDGAALAFVDPDAGTMTVPLHPSGELAGGAADVRISDETGTCAPFSFSIEEVPAATGEYAAVVDLMQELIEAQADLVGFTVAELMAADVTELPLYVAPLAVSQSFVDHPGNPNSMRAVLAGTAPDLEGLDPDLLDGLLALTDLRRDMQAALATTREGRALLDAPPSAPSSAPLLNALDCMFGGIDDADSLDRCMELGRDKIPGPAGTEARQLLSNYVIASSFIPALKPLMSAVSQLLFAMGHYDDILASNLPTEFVSMSVEPRPATFEEDREGPGTWAPATVVATSTGWRFDRLFFDSLLRSVKATPTYRSFMRQAGSAAQNAVGSQAGNFDDFFAEFFSQAFTQAMKSFFGLSGGSTELSMPPRTFGPIDISAETYSVSRIVTGDALARVSHQDYEPRAPGISLLEVITAEGKFGSTSIVTDPFVQVEVLRIGLEFLYFLEPVPDVFVSPGETIDLNLTVANSAYPNMVELLSLQAGQGTATLTLGDGETLGGRALHQVSYTAPDDLTELPAVLTARHTADTGARAFGSTDRVGFLTIRARGIQIVTAPTCLALGATLQIEVAPELGDDEVVWSASGGSISGSGLFTAPDGAETVTVGVALVDHPELNDSVQIQVGGCSCQASVRIDGQDAGETRMARFFLNGNLDAVTGVEWAGGVVGPDQSSAELRTFGGDILNPQAIPFGTVGTYSVVAGGLLRFTPWRNPEDPENPTGALVSMTLEENDGGNILSGSASGQVALFDSPEPRMVPFSMTFRIEADPRYSDETTRVCQVD